MNSNASIREKAKKGIYWSIVQSWGNRVFTTFLTIFIARILSPEDYGIASAAALALLLIPLIAEMGFGDSIMQRRDLKSIDVNLPFFISTSTSIILVSVFIAYRDTIAKWAGLEDKPIYLIAIASTVLISVPTAFQEAMYKRNMQFRDLAIRSFTSSICGGISALIAALAGLGIWVFIIQGWVSLSINAIWIWSRPQWLPTTQLNWISFRQMLRFGLPILVQRIIDFIGTRTVDMVIISKIGLAGYGLYVVGSRLYQIMMQLLQSALYDVSLTLLSTISHERERLAQIYLRTVSIAAKSTSPLFVLAAALAPEICGVLFGEKWKNVDAIANILLIVGAVHCVQYLNGSFLSARGRPELSLITGITRSLIQILSLIFFDADSVVDLTLIYACATLAATPLSFSIVAREIKISFLDLYKALSTPIAISTISYFSVQALRPHLANINLIFSGFLLFLAFIFCFTLLLAIMDKKEFVFFLSASKNQINKIINGK